MNILQVVSKLDSSQNAEDVIALTRFFTLNGHKIIVASPASERVKEIDEVGARHRELAVGGNILSAFFSVIKLARIISEENIQIAHARGPASSFVSFFATRFLRSRSPGEDAPGRVFVATVYNFCVKGLFAKSQFWAKRVICLNENSARNLINTGLLLRRKARIIPPFVRPGAVRQRQSKNFIVGAELPVFFCEAVQNFIKTVSILSRTVHNIKVVIEPSAPQHGKEELDRLRILIKRHSLERIVTVLPSGDAMQMSNLNIFVQFNDDRNVPTRRILQCQASGIPVVTTHAEWIGDYVENDKTGFVCNADNPQEIAARINSLFRNERLRGEIADRAKRRVEEKFNIKTIMESTLGLYKEAVRTADILVIKIGALGDAILITPSLGAIREKFPKARISVLVDIKNRDVFSNSPYVDELIVCDFKERDKGLGGLLRTARKLRAFDFDMVIDFQNNRKSHLLAMLSSAPKRFGYDNGKYSFLLNRKVKGARLSIDPVEHQSKVLGLLGIHNIDKRLKLRPLKEDEEWADNFLKSHWISPALSGSKDEMKKSGVKDDTKLVALNINSSSRWITKLWPVEYYVEISNRLARDFGIRVVLIGRERGNKQIDKFLKDARCKPINALGRTNIPRLAALIKRCSLLLSPDSAPIHVAAGVGTPFIAFFGPTDPKRHLPPLAECVVLKKDLKCSPCYHSHCSRGYRCMRSIKPDEVYEAILKMLGIKSLNQKQI